MLITSSSIQTLLSVSELHRICVVTLADFTAGRELHPALKIILYVCQQWYCKPYITATIF